MAGKPPADFLFLHCRYLQPLTSCPFFTLEKQVYGPFCKRVKFSQIMLFQSPCEAKLLWNIITIRTWRRMRNKEDLQMRVYILKF